VLVAPSWAVRRVVDVRYTDVQAWIAELSVRLSASMVATVYSPESAQQSQ